MRQPMSPADLLRIYNNVMRREYAAKWMREKRAKMRAHRICPDCGAREVEYRHIYCSECAEVRRQMSNDICDHNRRMKLKGATA